MDVERKLVLYTGRVQGVGFRQTTVELAREYALGGTVRNLADGRVELIAEGSKADIQSLLAAIRQYFSGYIVDEKQQTQTPEGLKPPLRIGW
ncbi:MAG TPA: acylphosphatase [Phycisphaerae bacterium]|nr:acylphosphatase [Phycisphaerae bacterium]